MTSERTSSAAAVAVTGVGCVTPLGGGATALFDGWAAGTCVIEDGFARCDDLPSSELLSRAELRRSDRHVQMALLACHEAVEQAGWQSGLPYEPSRIGCVTATTMGGQRAVEHELAVLRAKGPKAVAPLRVLLAAPNAVPIAISMRLNLQAECYGLHGACAGGAQAVGAGVRIIRSGACDAMIVGGVDAELTGLVRSTYSTMGAMSRTGVCRPFDRRRDGMTPGEGAGILVLEEAARARARNAPILGEIVGYGASSDAHHLTAPHERGQALAIRNALDDATVAATDIRYVNAHGSATPLNDVVETNALKLALDEHAVRVPVSSLKSAIGHLQGAAGAVELIATLFALRARVAPPTLGLEEPDDGLDLDYVPLRARPLDANGAPVVGLSNSFGLGGHNACLVVRT